MGLASNRQAEKWIKEGRIKVDGEVVTSPATAIDPDTQEILLDGRPLQAEEPPKVYWLFHKPPRAASTRSSAEGSASIFDLPALRKLRFQVAAVDRLDFKSEGLMILSNDGDLVHRAARRESTFERQYQVLVTGRLSRQQERDLRAHARIEYIQGQNIGASRGSWYLLCVGEPGINGVRKRFEAYGMKVIRLVRIGFGGLSLPDDLEPGEYRQLSSTQIRKLKKLAEETPSTKAVSREKS